MKKKELIYHYIDWSLALAAIIVPLSLKNYAVAITITICVLCIFLLICLLIKNNQLKRELSIYETLLKYPIPLYGIINYIFRRKDSKKSYQNTNFELDDLILSIGLVGELKKNKDNDLQFCWTFLGKNVGQSTEGNFYLRIGGDSSVPFEKLGVKCVDCSIDELSCAYRDKLHECEIQSECYEIRKSYFIKNDNQSSPILYLLDIKLANTIKPHNKLKLKVSYIWPQCYNCRYDFIMIDPNNFASHVCKIRLHVKIDNVIIKDTSMVQLFSINTEDNIIQNEGQVCLMKDRKSFDKYINTEPKKLYFMTIENE